MKTKCISEINQKKSAYNSGTIYCEIYQCQSCRKPNGHLMMSMGFTLSYFEFLTKNPYFIFQIQRAREIPSPTHNISQFTTKNQMTEMIAPDTCSLYIIHWSFKTVNKKSGLAVDKFLRSLFYLFRYFSSRRETYYIQ